jgi:formylglycine-generating enzyme required for sulfatase activity
VTVDVSKADQCFYRIKAGVTNSSTPLPDEMVLILGGNNSGTNPLGAGESYDPNYYPETYSLSVESFYMDRYEVTKALWDEVASWADDHSYDIGPADGAGKATNHPVHSVTWYECVKWCNARSEKEGRRPAYYTTSATSTVYRTGEIDIEDNCVDWAHGYRLPTDEEWEYAARGGVADKRFPWGGNTISHSQANYLAQYFDPDYDLSSGGYHPDYETGNKPYTSPVGAFEAGRNAYGLYEMSGNVREWCWDWHPSFVGMTRVHRGGHWEITADSCRVAARNDFFPGFYFDVQGFRTVLPAGP